MSGKKKIIQRIGIILVSAAMIVCFILLFVAASRDRGQAVCKAVDIMVDNNTGKVFVDQKDMARTILGDKTMNPVGKALDELDIQHIEQAVIRYPWVKKAELYVDNHNVLRTSITQRVPIARIFTGDGASFYMDQELKHLPLTASSALKLPVFTGLKNSRADAKDSTLVGGITALSKYLADHPFWMAQIDQININDHNEFELIPTVGNVLIEFGNGDEIEEKFNKLLTFYKRGLNNIGWGYYDTLSLQYRGQVVATRKDKKGIPVIDSLLTKDGYNLPEPESNLK